MIQYSAQDLEPVDLCGFTKEPELLEGVVSGTDVEIISISDGEIKFKTRQTIPQGKLLTGVINTLKFKIKTVNPSTIICTMSDAS